MKKVFVVPILLLIFIVTGAALAAPTASSHSPFPDSIPLPDGFFPEGIVVGKGANFYTGSLVDGTIFHGDLRSGEMLGLSDPLEASQLAVGLAFDERTNFVYAASGFGPAGRVAIFDGQSLELLYNVDLNAAAGFVNDVIVTEAAAFLTDSAIPVMYRLGLDSDSGLPDPGDVTHIPLSGFDMVPGFNANGIVATGEDRWLIIVNSASGVLYRVDPVSGDAVPVDLGGESVASGDGLVLSGNKLYVVQNALQQVTVFKMTNDFSAGHLLQTIVLPGAETPTTADLFGNSLYLVDARFPTPVGPDVAYEVTRVDK